MAEATFNLKKGTEVPDQFDKLVVRHWSPDKPANETDWDGFLAGAKASHDDALSAHATLSSGYNLDRQKTIKSYLAKDKLDGADKPERHPTIEEVLAFAQRPAFRKIVQRRLRGTPKPGSKTTEQRKNKIAMDSLDQAIADARSEGDEDAVKVFEKRKARLEALMKEQAASPATPAAAPAAPAPAEKPKNGSKK